MLFLAEAFPNSRLVSHFSYPSSASPFHNVRDTQANPFISKIGKLKPSYMRWLAQCHRIWGREIRGTQLLLAPNLVFSLPIYFLPFLSLVSCPQSCPLELYLFISPCFPTNCSLYQKYHLFPIVPARFWKQSRNVLRITLLSASLNIFSHVI